MHRNWIAWTGLSVVVLQAFLLLWLVLSERSSKPLDECRACFKACAKDSMVSRAPAEAFEICAKAICVPSQPCVEVLPSNTEITQ